MLVSVWRSPFLNSIKYPWRPSLCFFCQVFGHTDDMGGHKSAAMLPRDGIVLYKDGITSDGGIGIDVSTIVVQGLGMASIATARVGPVRSIKGKVKNEVEVRTTYAFVALDVGMDDVLGVVVPINGPTGRAGVSFVPATSELGVVGGRMVKTLVCKTNVVGHAVDVDQMVQILT
ncbi:hypothetical protein RHMOL_Rhmol13G0077400 [Rhododendron molle]|uniref:Uncharacterized protein n=1 Tax=Rhododendron molle TaxID=49168 RepID=A0ACC0L5K3_RHOML|nr:hypothetical protein RHMOL_Rhmol13G0077400 [Rhododendron molle]